jgi:predicted esterase
MTMAQEETIRTETHGRYLVEAGAFSDILFVGFHGYAESAEREMERLQSIEGAGNWTLVAVQALHRFYRNKGTEVVASWMTRQDRDHAVDDNTAYVRRVIDSVVLAYGKRETVFVGGFSQGASMAYRAACALGRPVAGVIALAGDVPPELDESALAHIPAVLIGRGIGDDWYTQEKLRRDETRLKAAGVTVRYVEFDGAHEWTPPFAAEVARFVSSRINT